MSDAATGHTDDLEEIWEIYKNALAQGKQALELAKEQYAFCMDIVDQGVGSIGALAKQLQTSTIWYFWWD